MGVSVGRESDEVFVSEAAPGRLGDPRQTQSTFRRVWRQEKTVGGMLASIFGGSRQARLPGLRAPRAALERRGSQPDWSAAMSAIFSSGTQKPIAKHNDIMHTARVQ
jgi:hypothetical protein